MNGRLFLRELTLQKSITKSLSAISPFEITKFYPNQFCVSNFILYKYVIQRFALRIKRELIYREYFTNHMWKIVSRLYAKEFQESNSIKLRINSRINLNRSRARINSKSFVRRSIWFLVVALRYKLFWTIVLSQFE